MSVHWSLLLVGTFVAGLFWTACESLTYYGKMRKRRMLGLVDPVVCNRFFLWGVGGLGAFLGIATLSASLLLGWRLVTHPLPMFGLFASGFSLAVTWWLAFLPPLAYLEHLRARAGGSSCPPGWGFSSAMTLAMRFCSTRCSRPLAVTTLCRPFSSPR